MFHSFKAFTAIHTHTHTLSADEGATAPTAQLVLTQATTEPETAAEQAARAAKRACHTMSKVVNKIVPELPLTVSTSGEWAFGIYRFLIACVATTQ